MFTGIVEALGTVLAITDLDGGRRLTVESPPVSAGLPVGASVAVNGTCLTAVSIEPPRFEVEMVPETLARTNLGGVASGDTVNLERAMSAAGRFDGHVVQGHVDGVGTVAAITPEGEGRRMAVTVPEPLRRYIVEKGSLTIDGVSLTVAAITSDGVEVALIPHTLEVTTLGRRAAGDRVNLEVDILAKYVERLLQADP